MLSLKSPGSMPAALGNLTKLLPGGNPFEVSGLRALGFRFRVQGFWVESEALSTLSE